MLKEKCKIRYRLQNRIQTVQIANFFYFVCFPRNIIHI